MRRIQLAEMTPHVHTFLHGENKVDKLSKWLISWIVLKLKSGEIKEHDLLPSKSEIACHIGVSQGTMQNVFRLLEDAGYIESKQKIGSYVKDRAGKRFEKLTSKKDITAEKIKKYMKDNHYKQGDVLISIRKLSTIIGVSSATVRAAITNLILQGVLQKKKRTYILTGRSFRVSETETKTLVEKAALNIKKFIIKNLEPGDKLPAGKTLASMFDVSLKTVHDAVKLLAKEGILYTRRGQYGTIVLSITDNNKPKLYNYEIIENKLKDLLITNFKVGEKIPSIRILAKQYKTSEKTIKKALDNLSADGYVTFVRGRYGGTFVTDIPSSNTESYTWLALNPDYIPSSND